MARRSIVLRAPLKNCHLLGLEANLRMYSRVNQVMQTASTKARCSLSTGFPCSSMSCSAGRVLRVRATVERTMKERLTVETT